MRIIIETNGNGYNTQIFFNGKKQDKVEELHVTVSAKKKVKLQMVKELEGRPEFISYFGDDFKKYDEFNKPEELT